MSLAIPGSHDKLSRAVESLLVINLLKHIDLNLHWTFSHIRYIPTELAIELCHHRMIKLNLIDIRSNTIKIQLISSLVLLISRRNTIPVCHIGSNVIHQFQYPACSYIGIVELDHLCSEDFVLLEGQLEGVVTLSWCWLLLYLLQALGWLIYWNLRCRCVEKCLHNSILECLLIW